MDIFWREIVYQNCKGEKPLLPSFGDSKADSDSIDKWNDYLKTASATIIFPPPHPFTDGQSVELNKDYEVRYQIREFGSKDYDYCSKDTYDRFNATPQLRRIVAIPLHKEETPAHQTGAKELVEKFMPHTDMGKSYEWRLKQAKQCALKANQLQIDENNSILEMAKLRMDERAIIVLQSRISELQQVRNEISNL